MTKVAVLPSKSESLMFKLLFVALRVAYDPKFLKTSTDCISTSLPTAVKIESIAPAKFSIKLVLFICTRGQSVK